MQLSLSLTDQTLFSETVHMPRPLRANVTLMQLAEASGFALATVSYALRNAPNVSLQTRQQIQELARKMGYQENPRVAALMAHIRQSRKVRTGERLAFVWVDTPVDSATSRSAWFAGARQRAEQLGYKMEEYRLGSAGGLSPQRLAGVLRARAINGVVIAPMSQYASFNIGWDTSSFSLAIIGNAQASPDFHHSGHHHFAGMHMALSKLSEAGYRRIVAVLDSVTNDRAKRAWSAAFLEHHPAPSQARQHLFLSKGEDSSHLARKLSATNAEIIITTSGVLDRLNATAEFKLQDTSRIILLDWRAAYPALGGVEQGEEIIAANAVDLVVGQLHRNERGIPDEVKMVLFPGRWHPLPTTAANTASRNRTTKAG